MDTQPSAIHFLQPASTRAIEVRWSGSSATTPRPEARPQKKFGGTLAEDTTFECFFALLRSSRGVYQHWWNIKKRELFSLLCSARGVVGALGGTLRVHLLFLLGGLGFALYHNHRLLRVAASSSWTTPDCYCRCRWEFARTRPSAAFAQTDFFSRCRRSDTARKMHAMQVWGFGGRSRRFTRI